MATPDESQARMIEVVAVEIVDYRNQGPCPHEPVELLVFEEEGDVAHGLVGVVAADHPFARARIVGLADAGEQQQAHVAEDIRGQQHQVGGLLEGPSLRVDIGDAHGPRTLRVSFSETSHGW